MAEKIYHKELETDRRCVEFLYEQETEKQDAEYAK